MVRGGLKMKQQRHVGRRDGDGCFGVREDVRTTLAPQAGSRASCGMARTPSFPALAAQEVIAAKHASRTVRRGAGAAGDALQQVIPCNHFPARGDPCNDVGRRSALKVWSRDGGAAGQQML